MAGGLGKGLKPGGELFKRTEPQVPAGAEQQAQSGKTPYAQQHKDIRGQVQTGEKSQKHKSADVRKHIALPEALAERLRRFCYERREKEARAVREALDSFLTKEGF